MYVKEAKPLIEENNISISYSFIFKEKRAKNCQKIAILVVF